MRRSEREWKSEGSGHAWLLGGKVLTLRTASRSLRFGRPSLLVKQAPLSVDSPAVATQGAILANDPVAGNENSNLVLRAGSGDGAGGGRAAEARRKRAVGPGLPTRDSLQRPPDKELEIRSRKIERDRGAIPAKGADHVGDTRSEERRVGKECRTRGARDH